LKESRFAAAVSFFEHVSQPFAWHFAGANASRPDSYWGRWLLPLGDTHPGQLPYYSLPYTRSDIKSFKSEELPGYGAVLRNNPGTMDETFFAFKAGPNRGHNHGDQLSFHYCAYGSRHAIDIMAGYNPRPLQEFWHNRLVLNHKNMDSYERLIAFKSSTDVDVAMGVVSSSRLREVPEKPPGIWQANYPYVLYPSEFVYTRTAVLVKNPSKSARFEQSKKKKQKTENRKQKRKEKNRQ